ncbi:hypothetical protein BS47DRAFT_1373936 [Hydnum rufescens UP504]|uniref:Uncharacterized protein n=1 Tax=Hydnum rufescens UP504 TaxID=1448309 RepID=A0A9P6AM17_9AGAM|nr:hypothetical protein BS47DRAFT_1373936 [Hydnum rufescens UP504]
MAIFSPKGTYTIFRLLYQIEYAMEAISHGEAIMGVLEKDSIILANVSIAKEGGYGCSGKNISSSKLTAQRHLFSFNEDIPIEQLPKWLCDLKQGHTQYGVSLCPFGLPLLYTGYNPHCQFQLHPSDLSGNYRGWTVMCIGMNNDMVQCLKQECKDGFKMDSTTLSSRKLEFLILMLGPMTKQPLVKIYKPAETDALLAKHGIEKMAG